jgi:hypothetical protein
MQILAPGQTKAYDMHATDGRHVLQVRVDRHHDGVAINVTGLPALDRTFPDGKLAEGRQYMAFLYEAARQCMPVWQIEAQAGVLTSAAAVVGQAEQDIIDGVTANMAQATLNAQPEPVDASDISTTGWHNFRQSVTRTAKPVSDAMDRILASATGGYIPRGKHATSVQLIALAHRGKVVLDYGWHGRTRVINGAWVVGRKPSEVAA